MLRVVLADDENKVILLMQKLIDWNTLGYEIVGTANDGLRALELVREKQPDLLITDVRMPGCDGIELIQRAKALQPRLHFIVVSGYRKFEYAQNALKYGVEDYLLKPLKQEELTGILLRLKDKLGQEAVVELQLRKSGERRQELLLEALKSAAERGEPFLSARQAAAEYGFRFSRAGSVLRRWCGWTWPARSSTGTAWRSCCATRWRSSAGKWDFWRMSAPPRREKRAWRC